MEHAPHLVKLVFHQLDLVVASDQVLESSLQVFILGLKVVDLGL